MGDEARPVERARSRGWRSSSPIRSAEAGRRLMKARGERERETHRRRPVGGAAGAISCRPSSASPPPSAESKRARERQRAARRAPRRGAKPAFASISAMTRRKRAIPSALPPGDIRFSRPSSFPICSCFEPMRGESQEGGEAGAPARRNAFLRSAQTRYLSPMTDILDRACKPSSPFRRRPRTRSRAFSSSWRATTVARDAHRRGRASFEASLTEAERGEFATDDEIRAIWAKHGL